MDRSLDSFVTEVIASGAVTQVDRAVIVNDGMQHIVVVLDQAVVARFPRNATAAASLISEALLLERRLASRPRGTGLAADGSRIDRNGMSTASNPGRLTRLIVRREHLHEGAQRSLFPSLCYRYWGHYTDADGNSAQLDAHMRDHAHVEDHIKRLKDSGLERFPFTDLDANQAWMQLVCLGADLVRWFQHLCCTGELAAAEPKRLRWTLWHTPARIVRRAGRDIIRIIDGWPTTGDLLDAHRRITAIC